MSSLAELARDHVSLSAAEVAHLQRLVASWGLAADLCFADLLLYVPAGDPTLGEPRHYVVMGQVRPATSQTLYPHDLMGAIVEADERPVMHRSYRSGEIQSGASERSDLAESVQVLAIPVRVAGRVIGVVARESTPSVGRRHGELETAYLEAFDRIARMITLGEFPFPEEETTGKELPRVGDGALLLDAEGRIRYASPNANSAAHRLGALSDMEGRTLGELGIDDAVWRQATQTNVPVTAELTAGPHTSVLAYAVPLLERRQVVGGLLLLRDISELRRLDRLLVTKDTHIREIHHRVKNNLQTISSLLRIQARRLTAPEARLAIEESVRRIGSIALVHETLSREAAEDVSFAEIARPLVRMVEDTLASPERPVHFTLVGDGVHLPAAVATPLALVLSELLQNAVDHAFGEPPPGERDETLPGGAAAPGAAEGHPGGDVQPFDGGDRPRPERDGGGPHTRPSNAAEVGIELMTEGNELVVAVRDNGDGLPSGFEIDRSPGLGLSIVRTLVQSELGGSMRMRDRTSEGASGTLIECRIPLDTR
jgi:two-component sensor histidine kinase